MLTETLQRRSRHITGKNNFFFDYFLFRKIRYSIFYEMAGMKSDDEDSVIDCLSRARESNKTKEKGLRTLLITAYVVYIAIQLFFMW